MSLAKDQKEFVTNKVKELGSFEAVNQLYHTDSPVDKWANALAMKLFSKTSLKRRKVK